ncbi:YybH family protein, partial [Candidatus Poribacteria bacterium]
VQAVQAFWQGGLDMGIQKATLDTVEVQVRGDIACEVGEYTLVIQPTADQTIKDKGKYVVVWKKRDGSWKLDVDIWNTSLPAEQ